MGECVVVRAAFGMIDAAAGFPAIPCGLPEIAVTQVENLESGNNEQVP